MSEAHLAHVRGRRGFRRDVSSGSVASPPRRGEALDPGLTSYLAHALASALDFAHTADEHGSAAGIIHRDVSPSNVLLSNTGEIKLADFGIAKATSLPGSIQSGAIKGKLPYINSVTRIIEKSLQNKGDPVSGCCVSFLVVSCCVGEIVAVGLGLVPFKPVDAKGFDFYGDETGSAAVRMKKESCEMQGDAVAMQTGHPNAV